MRTKKGELRPDCCKEAGLYGSIQLIVPDDFVTGNIDTPPKWMVKARCLELRSEELHGWAEVRYCPFCGTSLPKLEARKTTKNEKIVLITDGSYYCDTCSKRVSECRCLPPDVRWEIKRKKDD